MNWRYKNSGSHAIIWRQDLWEPGEEKETSTPVPFFTGLVCTQSGSGPDPVLTHEDLLIHAGETTALDIAGSPNTKQVALSLFCMGSGGALVRFNAPDNRPLPLDIRGFVHVMPWESCGRLFFENTGGGDVHISVSAVEVTS